MENNINENNMNEKNSSIVKETIKAKPLNKKKLLKKTITTVAMAVIFGFVFCFIFLILEPRIDKWINKDTPGAVVEFPEENVEDEMLPENMLTESETVPEETDELTIDDYTQMFTQLNALADNCMDSVVTVTSVQSGTDWFQNIYQNQGQSSGLIVAQNGVEYLILVRESAISKADSIVIIFHNGSQATAQLKQKDASTGYAIVAVATADLTESEKKDITVASLGTSNLNTLLGAPVIILGSPMGVSGGIAYGNITSIGTYINMVDSNYKLIMTDIYGSTAASGIILNLKGQVVGIVDNSYNTTDAKNVISAIGISELKLTIQNMSNDLAIPYMGIKGISVTATAYEENGVPNGAYITNVVLESPAMLAGLQSGDIIIKFDGVDVNNFSDYTRALYAATPGETVKVKVQRQTQGGYREMTFKVTLE